VRELLEVDDDRYRAVLSARAGCANSSSLCQQVLGHLQRKYENRFVYADCTNVERVVVSEDRAAVHARGHRVTAGHVVLCTNGFVDHVVEDAAGTPIRLAADQQITGRVGTELEQAILQYLGSQPPSEGREGTLHVKVTELERVTHPPDSTQFRGGLFLSVPFVGADRTN
jgi:glycine/D-amino acid oxidase-like deaminating enzyme